MKKLFKKSLPLMMAGLMFISSILPVSATVNDTQTITIPSTGVTEVFYNQESTFGVTIPKLIDLGIDKKTDYTVTVSGDISSDETVLVVPEESFLMKDQNTASPKDDVEATVTQNKIEWKFNEFSTVGNGNVSAPNLSAGTWQGTFWFNIKLQDCKITVEAKNENGEDVNATATYITGTERDILLDSLVETGMIDSVDDVDALINVKSDDFDGIADTTFDVSDIADTGDSVTILHFDEKKQEWEYIGTETVDENGLISGDFTSYSPVAFVKVNSDGFYDTIKAPLEPGLYDANGVMLCTWEESGINIEADYAAAVGTNFYQTNRSSAWYVLTNKYPTTTQVIIPDSVTKMGKNAFIDCDNLTEITIPNSVATIDYNAFLYCNGLTEITIPNSVTSIGNSAFRDCTNLSSVKLSNNLVVIDSFTFQGCKSLTNIEIPNNVTTLNHQVFKDCTSLINVELPNSITNMGDSIFQGCTSLTNIIFPDNMTTITSGMFCNCTSLTDIEIPNTVISIESYAFSGCTNLSTSIPDSVTSIGNKAFYNVPHIYYDGTATGSPWGALAIN